MTEKKKRPAVFLDRDGVINVDHGFVHKISEFEFLPGVLEALKVMRDAGYLLVVITNQAGVAYGMYTEDDVAVLHEWMQKQLADKDLFLDGIYICPHHPEKGNGKYLCDCNCRKPNIGLFQQAMLDLNIDLENSYMVGDRPSDIQAGINAGVKGSYLVRTGKPITEEGINLATYVFDDLLDFARTIIERKK